MFLFLIFLKFPRVSCSTEKEMQFHPPFWYSNIAGSSRSNVRRFKHDVLSETNGNGLPCKIGKILQEEMLACMHVLHIKHLY
jgi:hypothetical protein